jgi:glutamate synthase (NADPH/NADH) small chain
VLDSGLIPGGLLVNGVPAFKVDQSIVQRRIDLLKKCGVVFRLGVRFWDDLSVVQMRNDYNAVFLCADWRQARSLEIPGADLKGVVQALPFLLQKKTAVALDLPPLDIKGKRVVVLGGGDTALDCLRTAIRYGASQATGVYRRERGEMPCGKQEFNSALEEGVKFVFRAAPVAVLGNELGRVTGLRAIRTEPGPIDATGRQSFRTRSGSQFVLETDWVIAALGFEALRFPGNKDPAGLAFNEWGGIAVDGNQMTSMAGVFAGGDLVNGPSRLLNSVRDARRAARQIHSYLESQPSQF